MKKWLAVYTRDKCERKVSVLLTKKKIENFLPVNKVIKNQNNETKRIVSELIFNSFVFVKVTEEEIGIVKEINDVINFVHWLGNPAVFNDFEIISIINFLNNHYNVRIEKTEVKIDEEVFFVSQINREVLDENDVNEISNSQIRLQLPSLGYNLVAGTHPFNSELFEQTGKIIEIVL